MESRLGCPRAEPCVTNEVLEACVNTGELDITFGRVGVRSVHTKSSSEELSVCFILTLVCSFAESQTSAGKAPCERQRNLCAVISEMDAAE
jgi:hypothetical protein